MDDQQAMLLNVPAPAGRPDRVDDADPLSAPRSRRGAAAPQKDAPDPLPEPAWPAWADEWLAQPAERCQAAYVAPPRDPDAVAGPARRFPLGCLVRATLRLAVPQAGTLGVVVGHGDDGTIIVRQTPAAILAIGMPESWLEVVARRQEAPPPQPVEEEDEMDDGSEPL